MLSFLLISACLVSGIVAEDETSVGRELLEGKKDPCKDYKCDDPPHWGCYEPHGVCYVEHHQPKCRYKEIDCKSDNLCEWSYCHKEKGECVTKEKRCRDGDKCTVDSCDPKTGECVHEPKDCDDHNKCTEDKCYHGECKYKDIVCEPKKCHDVKCDPKEGCVYTPIECKSDYYCKIGYCDDDTGKCKYKHRDCRDGDKCTYDKCIEHKKKCVHWPKDCKDGDKCTRDYCKHGKCYHEPRYECGKKHDYCDDKCKKCCDGYKCKCKWSMKHGKVCKCKKDHHHG